MSASLKEFLESSYLFGGNAAFVEELYEQFLQDPDTVVGKWRQFFERLGQDGAKPDPNHRAIQDRFRELARDGATIAIHPQALTANAARKQAGVLRMINAYRLRGHQHAHLDPLSLQPRPRVPDLDLEFHGLGESDLNTVFDTGSLFAPNRMKLSDIRALLQIVYCRHIGAEYMYITDTTQRVWLQERLEGAAGNIELTNEERRTILERITAAEGLERYLHTKYVGQKRFSLEGGDSLIPLLHFLIQHTSAEGVREIVIGMAHRGRLNVLVNILGKLPADLYLEFEDKTPEADRERQGDVKYHLGFSTDINTPGGPTHVALAFNPSHLEIIDPVVIGSARSRQEQRQDETRDEVIPVLIHGDAAFAGQGVVMETFNMSQARGFAVGGTLHIVLNNQIGFTTSDPLDTRSTVYCTEVAKMVQAPIFHVNGDDPEAVVFVTRLAIDYRREFNKDVVIDLVCYRRHGHNEADEPSATQPVMYQNIRQHPTTRQLYADKLIAAGTLVDNDVQQMTDDYRDRLDAGDSVAQFIDTRPTPHYHVDWSPYADRHWSDPVDTTLSPERIRSLAAAFTDLPEGFVLQPRVKRIIDNRRKMAAGEIPMDWGFAETLAYASLLDNGTHVRVVGQDSARGTFFHRHAVLHNQEGGSVHIPLKHVSAKQADFTIIDSLLSEEAVLGFEYGYATAEPETLVIWEAQFGDFANGAQVVIDQFISSGEAKWGRMCGLTLFLPHGYEGQGPEHSSARLDRFLQLCAMDNMQVCVPTTPAQMLHMLRRQMLRKYRKPLIVMTPKSLLRHRLSVSPLEALTGGGFQVVIPETSELDPTAVDRIVLCAGKVYYDLIEAREERGLQNIAIIRIEQLYPFPEELLCEQLGLYAGATKIVWCQEEPLNQGAWYQSKHHFKACIRADQQLLYAGRPRSPSPAVGYFSVYRQQQETLVDEALLRGQLLEKHGI